MPHAPGISISWDLNMTVVVFKLILSSQDETAWTRSSWPPLTDESGDPHTDPVVEI